MARQALMDNNQTLEHHIGFDGFLWWVGVVESVADPLKVGRCKVRILGIHTPDLSTDDLPWSIPLAPCTHSTSVASFTPGDWVAGFFVDSILSQQPVVLGVFPAIPQTMTPSTPTVTTGPVTPDSIS